MAGGMSPWSSTTLVNVDGGLLDPDTLPDVAGGGPTDVPPSTPNLIVTGGPDFFVLRTEDASDSWSWIEYHVSTSEGFVPVAGDTATMVGSTRGVLVTNQLPSGDAYQRGTEYFFAAVAVNELGPAPSPSATVGAMLDPSAIQDIVTNEIVAGFILAGRVQFGQGYIDADEGIVLPQPDGTTTRLPVDGITPSTISGFLIANGMVVKDSAYFYGLTQLSGELRLNQGVPDPRNAPSISWFVPSIDGRNAGLSIGTGLSPTSDNSQLMTLAVAYTSAGFIIWDKDDEPAATYRSVLLAGVPTNKAGGGVAYVNGEYFALVNAGSILSPDWRIYVFDAAAVDAAAHGEQVALSRSFLSTSPARKPALGTDGTSLVLAHATSGGNLRVRYLNPTNGATTSDNFYFSIGQRGLSGIAFSPEPAFENLMWFSFEAESGVKQVWCLSQTQGARQSNHEFAAAADVWVGLCWDGTHMRTASSSAVYKYASMAYKVYNPGGLVAGYTWYDGNPTDGTHETALSPTTQSAIVGGRFARIEASPAPHVGVEDPLQTDAARLVRIYASSGSAVRLLETLPEGESAVEYEGAPITGTDPPTETTFVGTDNAAGLVRTDREDDDGPLIRLEGDGAWRLGNFSADSTGAVTIDPSWTVQGGDPWHTVATLENGWTFNNQAAYPVQYKRDIAGNLHIRGLINDTGTQGSAVFHLPEGWRPDMTVPYISLYAHANGMATADVLPDGVVRVRQRTGTSGNFISLKMVLPLL